MSCCCGNGGLTPTRVCVLRLRVRSCWLVTAFDRDDDGPYCGRIVRRGSHHYGTLWLGGVLNNPCGGPWAICVFRCSLWKSSSSFTLSGNSCPVCFVAVRKSQKIQKFKNTKKKCSTLLHTQVLKYSSLTTFSHSFEPILSDISQEYSNHHISTIQTVLLHSHEAYDDHSQEVPIDMSCFKR